MGPKRIRMLAAASIALAAGGVAYGVFAALHHESHKTHRVSPPPPRHRRPRRPRRVRGAHDAPVPILMYHVIYPPPRGAPFPQLFVRPSDFAGQMRWLARRGYHAVTLRRVYDYWRKGYALPRRPIVISFDDGYLSDYANGFRILRAHRWPGVLNLEVRHLTRSNLPPWRVRNLIAAGWEIDAHTVTHPDLTTVDAKRLRYEVDGSRRLIRRKFHVAVQFFCYPSGRYDRRVIAEVRRAGYLGATTTRYGLASRSDLFTLARVRVNGTDGVRGFASKMRGLRASPY